ncbi:MAG: hypothetical protein A2341_10695 [Deltaproteobacteria bacterium RIFOXYB12_FULL_58_9]|nr:MAG: hypothetical protein A2341_10695 [Deltaproteobacteria bacterium RIFOXYB12_FULL_58_9]
MKRLFLLCAVSALFVGCVAGSQSVRPETLMPGQFRIGIVQGVTRNHADDFAFAEPTGETKKSPSPVWLTEIAAHYGVARDFDVGLRLRPFSLGGRVELMYQVVREKTLGLGIAVGLGIDGFYRSRDRLGCVAGGCFSREYAGMVGDVPLILSRHLWRRGVLFLAGRYNHYLIFGEERFATPGLDDQVIDKEINQWGAGWVVGLQFELRSVRIAPQLAGGLVRMPSGGLLHALYPSLDIAIVL